ncbi:MAG: nucleoside deaminase [Ignavibacteria bacterium]|nr:nucleoside deaminase [Ignavibacteria bacterium]
MTSDEKYMQMAIDKCREGVDNGQTPFAACIVKDDKVIACNHNIVWASNDITAHGEINAIRNGCLAIGSIDLSGSTIYSTCEPCPMCFTAIHWARIDRIFYGANINDAEKFGFNELKISNKMLKELGNCKVKITGDFMKNECVEIFEYWALKKSKKVY